MQDETKKIKEYSNAAPMSVFNFAFTIANFFIFFLNSEIISALINKVFNKNSLLTERQLKIVKEVIVFSILALYLISVLLFKGSKFEDRKEEKQEEKQEKFSEEVSKEASQEVSEEVGEDFYEKNLPSTQLTHSITQSTKSLPDISKI